MNEKHRSLDSRRKVLAVVSRKPCFVRQTLTAYHLHHLLVRVVRDHLVVDPQDAVARAEAGAPRRSVLFHRLHVHRVVPWKHDEGRSLKQSNK